MRIDKYLWAVRFFKSRNAASIACKKGYVQVDGQNAKPSREVYTSDKISIRKNQLTTELYVLDLPKSRVGAKLVPETQQAAVFTHKNKSVLQSLFTIGPDFGNSPTETRFSFRLSVK